jgi:hypothetical protein
MSIVCLLILSKAGSQTVTNSDTVKIHVDVARKVIKDLLLLDATKRHNDTLVSVLSLKNDIIANKDLQIENYKKIGYNYDIKIGMYDSELHNVNRELKTTRRKLSTQSRAKWLFLAIGVIATSVIVK